jgi:sugar lactone lactonase YvrE
VALGFLLAGLGYFWMIMRAWRVMRFLHRSICRRRISADRRRCESPAYAGPERRTGGDRRLRAVAGRLPRDPGSKDFGADFARSR